MKHVAQVLAWIALFDVRPFSFRSINMITNDVVLTLS